MGVSCVDARGLPPQVTRDYYYIAALGWSACYVQRALLMVAVWPPLGMSLAMVLHIETVWPGPGQLCTTVSLRSGLVRVKQPFHSW
jgi:hypothetical protein